MLGSRWCFGLVGMFWATGVLLVQVGCGGAIDSGVVSSGGSIQATAFSPSARGGAPAVWMSETKELVLFGGMLPITGDTFTYDTVADRWREVGANAITNGPTPPARCHHTLVPGGDGRSAIMFGGFSFGQRFNDVWVFDSGGQRWTQLDPDGAIPARRCLHTSTYISSSNQMLMYGGISGSGVLADDFFTDTHILDLTRETWREIGGPGPGGRSGAISFYDATDEAVYLWGGRKVDRYPATLWRFDLTAETWEQVPTEGAIPTGREDPTYFWDAAERTLWMFSGWNDTVAGVLLTDAFALDVSTLTWRTVDVGQDGPPSRWRASVVFDGESKRGWMFGGWRDFGGRNAFADTWTYDAANDGWRQVGLADDQ